MIVKGLRWILIVVALLAGNVIAVGTLIAKASGEGERQVLPDYYRRAAAWGQTMAEAQASADLGWRAEVADRAGGLTVRVTDRAGLPVTGAQVRIAARHRAHADGGVEAIAVEAEAGHYRVDRELDRGGLWDVDVHVHRGGGAWVRRFTVEHEAP
jgi:nitrogen fixation protein FixH